MLDNVVIGDVTRMGSCFNTRLIVILLGIAVELFIQYAHFVCKILQGVGQNWPKNVDLMLIRPNSWLLASQSLVLAFAPVASAKNKGLVGKLMIILLVPFYSQRSQFLGIWTKKHKKRRLVQKRCLILGS
jgi:hypothetical protein